MIEEYVFIGIAIAAVSDFVYKFIKRNDCLTELKRIDSNFQFYLLNDCKFRLEQEKHFIADHILYKMKPIWRDPHIDEVTHHICEFIIECLNAACNAPLGIGLSLYPNERIILQPFIFSLRSAKSYGLSDQLILDAIEPFLAMDVLNAAKKECDNLMNDKSSYRS